MVFRSISGPAHAEGGGFHQACGAVDLYGPEGEWIFIVGQLNTHKSVSLVRPVAERCGLEADLGKKDEPVGDS
jgi:hypothetical protein